MNVFFKSLLYKLVFGNVFIAICAASMIFSTFMMIGIPVRVTPFTVFLTFSTYILYNFHRISFRLNYSGMQALMKSAGEIKFRTSDKFFYLLSMIIILISVFYINPAIYPFLIPTTLLTLSYSIPFIRKKSRKVRLLEIYYIKTPVLALVWGITTTIIPLVEQNISLSSSFVLIQAISRSLFIFALCIPFEMRDLEKDKGNNIRTIPVVYGIRRTKIIGTIIILLEILTHHLMPQISQPIIIALDISSLFALYWIFKQGKTTGKYYYKLFVDGTMILRFLFIFMAMHIV